MPCARKSRNDSVTHGPPSSDSACTSVLSRAELRQAFRNRRNASPPIGATLGATENTFRWRLLRATCAAQANCKDGGRCLSGEGHLFSPAGGGPGVRRIPGRGSAEARAPSASRKERRGSQTASSISELQRF